jgi:hypothetical protein
MHVLTAWELLTVWEQGRLLSPLRQALLLLQAACPEESFEQLAELTVGKRDARLLTLREGVFGPELVSCVNCPGCADSLELVLNSGDIRVVSGECPDGGLGDRTDNSAVFTLSQTGYEVTIRLPNSLDLVSLEGGGMGASPRHLLERCVLTASQAGVDIPAGQLPDDVLDAAAEWMAQADPQADVQVELNCPSCGHRWQVVLDIVSYFWSEIETWAIRVLREVHLLASAYGWREADILSMSSLRRQIYLELITR